jgi:hypothetical protein
MADKDSQTEPCRSAGRERARMKRGGVAADDLMAGVADIFQGPGR